MNKFLPRLLVSLVVRYDSEISLASCQKSVLPALLPYSLYPALIGRPPFGLPD